MPNNDIVYLLKFTPMEAHIDDLINGRLYMNAAGYYQGLPGEQGDPFEASIVPGYAATEITVFPSTACMGSARTTPSTTTDIAT